MAKREKIRYSKARTASMQSLATSLQNFLNAQAKNYNIQVVRLWQNWHLVLGQDLGSQAIPLGHREHTLVIGAEDNLLMQDLSYASQEILDLTNEFIGERFFKKVEFQLMQGRRRLDAIPFVQKKSNTMPDRPKNLGNLEISNPSIKEAYLAYVHAFNS